MIPVRGGGRCAEKTLRSDLTGSKTEGGGKKKWGGGENLNRGGCFTQEERYENSS